MLPGLDDVESISKDIISGYVRQNFIYYIPVEIKTLIILFYEGKYAYFGNNIDITFDVLHPYKFRVAYLSSCLCNDGQSIIIFGGWKNNDIFNKVYKYNTKTDEYISLCKMPKPSYGFKVARTPDNKIVAIGLEGYESQYFIYDEHTNKWENKTLPNNFEVCWGTQIAFDLNGNLHVIGGIYDSKKCHYVCEWNKQKWIKMNDLSFKIYGAGLCCRPDGLLYLFGGLFNGKISDLMWIYNVNTKEWKQGTSMPHKRRDFGYINTNNEIIVAGGYDGDNHTTCNDIFIYNFKSQKWLISNKKLLKNIESFTMTITNNFEIHSFGGNNNAGYVDYHFIIKSGN